MTFPGPSRWYAWGGAATLAVALVWLTNDTSPLLAVVVVAGVRSGQCAGLLATGLAIAALSLVLLIAPDRSDAAHFWPQLVVFALTAVAVEAVLRRGRVRSASPSFAKEARLIVESMPGLGWFADAKGNLRCVNRAALDYTGWRSGLDGFAGAAVLHPDEKDAVAAHWRRCLETGDLYHSEHRLRRFDGTWRWFCGTARPSRDAAGRITGWYGCSLDIDDRKKAEEALRASEQDFRAIVESIPGMIFAADSEGNHLFANRRLLDYVYGAGAGMTRYAWADVVHPDDRAAALALRRDAMAAGQPYETTCRRRRFDDSYRWFRVRVEPARDDGGRIVRWYGLLVDVHEQKLAENALQATELELRAMLDNIPGMVVASDGEGKRYFANRRTLDYVGAEPSEATDYPWGEVAHPDDRAAMFAVRRAATAAGQAFEIVYRRRRFDGEFRWCRVRMEPVPDHTGRISRWYGLLVDIHEQKLAEHALRNSERELRLILDRIPGMIAVTDGDDNHFYSNQRMLDYLGIDQTDPADFNWPEMVHPDERMTMIAARRRALAAGEAFEAVYRRRRFDGEFRWFRLRAEPSRDEAGRIVRWYALIVDVHEQKLAEQALQASERQFRTLIDTIPGLVWCATPQGDTFYLNKRLLDYAGFTPEQAALARYKLIHPDDLPLIRREWAEAIGEGRSFQIVYRLRRADGVYRWHEGRAAALRDVDGSIIQWYGVNVDIDDRLHTEQALRLTQTKFQRAAQLASLAELSASIAHEVNQPLAAVVANGHACQRWLSANPPSLERARLSADRIIRDANAAADVVSRVRALFRRSTVEKERVDLAQLVDEVCKLLADDIAAHDASIELGLASALPPVLADRVQMQQVLVNLIRNGIEAMDQMNEQPRILFVGTRLSDLGGVEVEIRDHGVGIKDTEKIFEPFFTTKADGMGMGLAICRSIVEAHDGHLWAAPASPQGTRFILNFPALAEMPA